MTCVVAALFFFIIADFPEDVKWLTPEERHFVKARLHKDVGDSQRHERLKFKEILNIIRERMLKLQPGDYIVNLTFLSPAKILLGGFMYFGLIVPAYGYGVYRVLEAGPFN